MKVRLDQCGIPKCKGCGKHLNFDHEDGCLIVLSEVFRRKRKGDSHSGVLTD